MPLSETGTGQMWYAPNRLGYSTLGLFCWGWGMGPAGRKIMVLCQVMEKPGYLTAAILLWLLPQIVVEGTLSMDFWSDRGTHLCCYVMLGCIGFNVPEAFHCSTRTMYGEPGHLKGIPDGMFGEGEHKKQVLRNKTTISEIPQLAALMQKEYDRDMEHLDEEARAEKAPTSVWHFFPEGKHEVMRKVRPFDPRSLPCTLSQTHAWTFRINDPRRTEPGHSLLGRRPHQDVVTGIDCWVHTLPGMKSELAMTHPRFKPLTDSAAASLGNAGDEECEAADASESAEALLLQANCKVVLNWRVAYRREAKEKELTDLSKIRGRLAAKYQNYPELARIARDGIRHRKPIPNNNAKKIVRQRLKHADQRRTRKIKGRGPRKLP